MPRWTNNPADVSLRTIYEPMDDCILKIVAFRPTQGGDIDPITNEPKFWGVGVDLEFVQAVTAEGKSLEGKKLQTVFNLGNKEFGESMAKQFQMAAYGFSNNAKGVEAFNEFARNMDWSVDTEANELGMAWTQMEGRPIKANLDVKPDKNGTIQQKITWKPIS